MKAHTNKRCCSRYIEQRACIFSRKKPEHLIERFIEVVTENQEAIAADVLKQHPYPSGFQMLPGEVKE